MFTSEALQKKVDETAVEHSKGKEVATPESGEGPQRRLCLQKRIIKKSDYKVVDQLNQTPSKISILSLLMSSGPHRTALLKFLNEAYVAEDISVNQFDNVVANLSVGSCLMFTDDDLPPNGREHTMALHISIKCADATLSQVLVGTCSSLNVLSKTTLTQLNVEGVQMRQNALVVKVFDGSKRTIIGEIDLPILIGPQTVTSTLHQKRKFVTGDKLVSISREEGIIVSHLSSFKYMSSYSVVIGS